MRQDHHLEAVSEKIRKGEPVGFLEAIAAINYQETLRREREARRLWPRLVAWLKKRIHSQGTGKEGAW